VNEYRQVVNEVVKLRDLDVSLNNITRVKVAYGLNIESKGVLVVSVRVLFICCLLVDLSDDVVRELSF
jgi:hypothetical protein